MIYLLDANTLIDANRDYYSIDAVPEFWDWLIGQGYEGKVKIPAEIYEEIEKGKDNLAEWIKNPTSKEALLYNQDADPSVVSEVVNTGYGAQLTDIQIEQIGRDPFLIAYAYADKENISIVTTEISKPSTKKPERFKIPDVCDKLQVKHMHTFAFIKALRFTTNWNKV